MDNGRYDHGMVPLKVEGADLTMRYLLVKDGSDDETVAICGAGDEVRGVAFDEAVADSGEYINVEHLGSSIDTKLVVAGEDITGTPWLVAGADGKAVALSATPGTYEVFGKCIKNALTDELLSFVPCPHQRAVS